MSAITAAGGFDLWPASSGQLGSLPTGGAANNNAAANGTWSTTGTWAGSGTVTVVRFYNLGASLASFYAGGGGTNTNAAQMQAGAAGMIRLWKNLKLAFYLFFHFGIRIPLSMNETQLAQVATLATAIATAAQSQGAIESEIDQLNAQLDSAR